MMVIPPAVQGHLLCHSLIRSSQYRSVVKPIYKHFHTTPRPQWIEPALTTTHAILEGLHSSTNLSWALTLPLSALLVRLTIILPLSLYTRPAEQERLKLQPLMRAWRHHTNRHIMRLKGHLGPAHCNIVITRNFLRQVKKGLYKSHGCEWWKNGLSLGQLPVFLVLIETVRAMCGTGKGLLGLAIGSMASVKNSTVLDQVDDIPTESCEAFIPIETTFATEGALWFPDLLVPDPQLLLPFILSGTIFTNIWLNTRLQDVGQERSVFQRRLTNSLKFIALIIGPATLQMPSAMLVYWISSSSFAMIQNLLLDRILPLDNPMKPRKPKAIESVRTWITWEKPITKNQKAKMSHPTVR